MGRLYCPIPGRCDKIIRALVGGREKNRVAVEVTIEASG